MNKYLEKIAGLEPIRKDTSIGRVKEQAPITSPGSKLTHGAKTLFSRAMLKAAEETSHKQELVNTGVIAGVGTLANFGAHKAMSAMPKVFGQTAKFHNAKIMALSGAAGLAADYAGVKLNKQINKRIS